MVTEPVQNNSPSSYRALKTASSAATANDNYELTFIHGLIKKCYGCDKQFTERQAPNDLIIKHLEIRPRYDKENKTWYSPGSNSKSNAYYHLRTECVKKIHDDFKVNSLVIPDSVQLGFTDEHRNVIRNAGFPL